MKKTEPLFIEEFTQVKRVKRYNSPVFTYNLVFGFFTNEFYRSKREDATEFTCNLVFRSVFFLTKEFTQGKLDNNLQNKARI